jgi:cytochrome c oxidase subunit 3
LIYLVTPFAIGLIGLIVWFVKSQASGNKFHAAIAKPMIVVFLSFFVGVGLGMILESGESHESGHHAGAAHGAAAQAAGGADHGDAAHADDKAHADADHAASHAKVAAALSGDEPVLRKLAQDETNSGIRGELEAIEHQAMAAGVGVIGSTGEKSSPIEEIKQETNTRSRAGVFFGIYYVMTGIHAIHILAGIGVLTWLLVRSVRRDFNRQYFGPVDYVGLYWHIVDLIWIYLFPLLYLIR